MNSLRSVFLLVSLILFLIVQILLFKNLALFGIAFCFIYLLYFLLLPIEFKTIPALILAFITGLILDMFYDTIGIHTACLLLFVFLRGFWIKLLIPTGGYDSNIQPTMFNMSFGWFATYSLPLLMIYHFTFFFIENLGTNLYFTIFKKAIPSVIFVFLMSIVVQLLFYRSKRGN
jgi:hypothetical protein